MQILQSVLTIIQFLCLTIMWVCLALFALKTLWNLGVPYAIIHEALRRPKEKHGWSIFVLLDLGLLIIAIITSALSGHEGILTSWKIMMYGVVCIVISYIHMVAVLLIGGYVFSLFPAQKTSLHDLSKKTPTQE